MRTEMLYIYTEFDANTNQTTKSVSKSRPSKRYRLREENTRTSAWKGSVNTKRITKVAGCVD